MKIRTQNLLVIVPLFLGLALLSGWLAYTVQRREILWGMHEEATSLAIAVAEFVDGDLYRDMLGPNGNPAYVGTLAHPFRLILQHEQAHAIFALTPDGRRLVFSVDSGFVERIDGDTSRFVVQNKAFPYDSGMVELMRRDSFYVTDVRDLPGKGPTMTAYAPILDSTGTLAGILGIDIDGTDFLLVSDDLLVKFGMLGGGIVLLGVIASLFLSGMFTRKIRELGAAADEVSGGNLDLEIKVGTIQEVSDLSNTFNTMSSVLKNVLSKIRRALIEGEQFRTENDLARVYVEEFWKPLDVVCGNVRVVGRMLGHNSVGAVMSVVEIDRACHAFVGFVRQEAQVVTATRASAVCSFLHQELGRRPVGDVLNEAVAIFNIESLNYLHCPADATEVEFWSLQPDGSGFHHRSEPLSPGAPISIHTFPASIAATIDDYLHKFARLSAAELVDDIVLMLDHGVRGCFLILKRASR